jgi:Kdo2-lipid IVA lauroyltransferase/acyltransferase
MRELAGCRMAAHNCALSTYPASCVPLHQQIAPPFGARIRFLMSDAYIPPAKRPVRWRLEDLAYRGMELLISVLPSSFAARLGALLGGVSYHLLAKRRRTVLRNLRIAFAGEKTMAEIEILAREVFRRTGANMLASLHTSTVDRAGLERALEIEGLEPFQAAISEGRGLVMLIAHMGNWEALAQQFPLLLPDGFKGATMYRPLNNPLLNKRVETTRAQAGVKLFSKKDSPLAMTAFLRSGGAIGVLSDQRAGNAGEIVPFMGRLTSCTPLPSIFARRTGAFVMGVSLTTIAPGRWRMKFHYLKDEPTTAGCMALLGEMIRTSPADVFWMQDRWRAGRRDPLLIAGKQPKSIPHMAFLKPRRVLAWLDEVPATAPELPQGTPADVVYEYVIPSGAPRPSWLPEGTRVHHWSSGKLDQALASADTAEVLPLEAVVMLRTNKELIKACRQAEIGILNLEKSPG